MSTASAPIAPPPPGEDCFHTSLVETWRRWLPLVLSRVAAVERAARALREPEPDAARVDAGHTEAHKLAGLLGIFGLHHGTDLARQLERELRAGRSRRDAGRLQGMAAELRDSVEAADPGLR